ncbi:MAG: helix-turn-helix domain-containing protein [Acidobacteriota bacterium]
MKLITAQEVAALLTVPVARVYELARTQSLPCVHLGSRQLRFDEERLHEWIESGGSAPADQNGGSQKGRAHA